MCLDCNLKDKRIFLVITLLDDDIMRIHLYIWSSIQVYFVAPFEFIYKGVVLKYHKINKLHTWSCQ